MLEDQNECNDPTTDENETFSIMGKTRRRSFSGFFIPKKVI
jgi:hypothetical protein